ncbi:adenosine deaminase/editase [Blastocladiella britannica]|nr:adenosine deaminase/editase [Blastocladiella britannica]
MDSDLVARAALDCLDSLQYRAAHVSGPRRDWTCVAALCISHDTSDGVDCIAIGCGLKCLNEREAGHTTVNDSHAEVLCRRAFRRYLLNEIQRCLQGKGSRVLVQRTEGESPCFELLPSVRLHMYISLPPCGDASLESLADTLEASGPDGGSSVDQAARTRFKQEEVRASTTSSAPLRGRNDFSQTGALRTKPGRNDAIPTRSLSCSDKLAMWQCVGWQGALLSHMIPEPMALSTVVVSSKRANLQGLERALHLRIADNALAVPNIVTTAIECRLAADSVQYMWPDAKLVTCPHAYFWWKGASTGNKGEYVVQGRRQGAAPNKDGVFLPKALSSVSKTNWFEQFLQVAAQIPGLNIPREYRAAKLSAQAYQQRKQELQRQHPIFSQWVGNDALLVDAFEATSIE